MCVLGGGGCQGLAVVGLSSENSSQCIIYNAGCHKCQRVSLDYNPQRDPQIADVRTVIHWSQSTMPRMSQVSLTLDHLEHHCAILHYTLYKLQSLHYITSSHPLCKCVNVKRSSYIAYQYTLKCWAVQCLECSRYSIINVPAFRSVICHSDEKYDKVNRCLARYSEKS